LRSAEAEWIDMSPAADGSQRSALTDFGKRDSQPAAGSGERRFFGIGDVLRNAELEFDDGAIVEIQSRFERCNIRLGDDVELVIGEHGMLDDCTISGGRLRVLGKFLERRTPGLIGPSELFVSEKGAVAATVLQVLEPTNFAFERGCRLRVQIKRGETDDNGRAEG
jgi:hypothetical protein